mgnify:CR=1 FL=1
METVFGFFLALIIFYVLLEWRLNKTRRDSEQRYADLEAKTRWLYERLQDSIGKFPTGGLNLSVDLTGGTTVEATFSGEADIERVRHALEEK